MGHGSRTATVLVTTCLAIGVGAPAFTSTIQQKGVMAKHASGTFDVTIVPQSAQEHVGDPSIGRMSIDKHYHGDIEGTGLGQMLTGMASEMKDSGAYVAIERIRGTLDGR